MVPKPNWILPIYTYSQQHSKSNSKQLDSLMYPTTSTNKPIPNASVPSPAHHYIDSIDDPKHSGYHQKYPFHTHKEFILFHGCNQKYSGSWEFSIFPHVQFVCAPTNVIPHHPEVSKFGKCPTDNDKFGSSSEMTFI